VVPYPVKDECDYSVEKEKDQRDMMLGTRKIEKSRMACAISKA